MNPACNDSVLGLDETNHQRQLPGYNSHPAFLLLGHCSEHLPKELLQGFRVKNTHYSIFCLQEWLQRLPSSEVSKVAFEVINS